MQFELPAAKDVASFCLNEAAGTMLSRLNSAWSAVCLLLASIFLRSGKSMRKLPVLFEVRVEGWIKKISSLYLKVMPPAVVASRPLKKGVAVQLPFFLVT